MTKIFVMFGFNTQPPEGGWHACKIYFFHFRVSTHSRPKAAGVILDSVYSGIQVSTHSRPKAAGSLSALSSV